MMRLGLAVGYKSSRHAANHNVLYASMKAEQDGLRVARCGAVQIVGARQGELWHVWRYLKLESLPDMAR